MKKIIYSLVFTAALGLSTIESKAIIHQGQATLIAGDGITSITFNCPGAGICYTGSSKSGSHIVIYGFPGDWVVLNVIKSADNDEAKDEIEATTN